MCRYAQARSFDVFQILMHRTRDERRKAGLFIVAKQRMDDTFNFAQIKLALPVRTFSPEDVMKFTMEER
jgi:hypothetical protein